MRVFATFILLTLIAFSLSAQPRRIVVERPEPTAQDSANAPFRYEAGHDSVAPRLVIDAGEMAYRMKVDSINKAAEDKIEKYIRKLERHFEDEKVEEEVGKLIGDAIMAQQMALLDLQIDRALAMKDTLWLKGIEMALRELIANSEPLREELRKQLDLIEHRFDQIEEQFEDK